MIAPNGHLNITTISIGGGQSGQQRWQAGSEDGRVLQAEYPGGGGRREIRRAGPHGLW